MKTLIHGGRVIDPANRVDAKLNLLVEDGRVAWVGTGMPEADQTIDATGKIVSPGFIDIHSHSDFTIYNIPLSESRILQGVTTELGGDCGLSPAPVNPERVDLLKRYVGFLDMGLPYNWTRMSEYLDLIEQNGQALKIIRDLIKK